MDTAEIRRRFIAHFEARDHTVVPSAPLLLDDPNLLFVNAGMVPFVPYFLGQEAPAFPRAVSVQKCVRTIDIEEVGQTDRHGTFFQMNGNFSFGDYFKEGAITYAWDLVTRSVADGGYGLEEPKLHVSVYLDDDESVALWKKIAGLPDEKIHRLGKVDNYWSMGIPGPCGPDSELFLDRGPDYGPEGEIEKAGDRYIEFWNLVFMQNLRGEGIGKDDFEILGELPKKNIDTGMGLERMAMLLQGKDSIYEIDEVAPVLVRAAELAGKTYGTNHEDDVRLRVVADHVRSGLMLISDGVTPGNEARGYVLRRILRRAVRAMRLLGVDEPTLPELMPASYQMMRRSYPELDAQWDRLQAIAYAEEEAFRQTLKAGTAIFDLASERTKRAGEVTLSGRDAFALHDTYGFPIDLTLEMAAEQGLVVDEVGFRQLMGEQRAMAKADAKSKKGQHADVTPYREVFDAFGPTDWQAYLTLATDSTVVGLLRAGQGVSELVAGEVGEVILDRTPFYAESGGQHADAGSLRWDGGSADVLDVQRPIRGLVVHQVKVDAGSLVTGAPVEAAVDPEWRLGAAQAHSGTHVVHASLRQVLGPTALQSGSYNRPGYLRLDFGWGSALSDGQVNDVEDVANQALRKDLPVSATLMTLPEAQQLGALALFGETYGEKVRVVEIGGEWSRELCGGTHVSRSSQIGTVVVTSESSVGSGNRRMEALVGLEGVRHLARERDLVRTIGGLLKAQPDDLADRVSDLLARVRSAEKEADRLRARALLSRGADLAAAAADVNGVRYVGQLVDGVGAAEVRTLALDIRGRLSADLPGVVMIVGVSDGKPSVVVALNDRARETGLNAGALVKVAAGQLGGSGGGKDDVAQGGGTDPSGAQSALTQVEQAVAGHSPTA
ncbi:MAG: alanyl-tRNA synthetase [Nocardioidaceae bacterium]|jgi:alanyl-tRNA synthetase|nr:alanyl-tRNA synthetase [Nocardioidaceae bacterium]